MLKHIITGACIVVFAMSGVLTTVVFAELPEIDARQVDQHRDSQKLRQTTVRARSKKIVTTPGPNVKPGWRDSALGA